MSMVWAQRRFWRNGDEKNILVLTGTEHRTDEKNISVLTGIEHRTAQPEVSY